MSDSPTLMVGLLNILQALPERVFEKKCHHLILNLIFSKT